MRRLDLRDLDSADVAELTCGVGDPPLGTPGHELARALSVSTNGNPFFVTELVLSLADAGAFVSEHGRLRLAEGVDLTAELPVSISETLARRLHSIPGDVRRCLGVAAVAGEEFDLDHVSAVVDDESAAAAIKLAVGESILMELPGRSVRYRFSHSLMQRYLYGELGPARQSELHRKLALAIEGKGDRSGNSAELARHWVEAVDAELGAALRYSVMAGDEALEKLAPDEAKRWYESALELLERRQDPGEAQLCELLIKRGEAERQAGDPRFRATLLEAAEIAHGIGDDDKLVRAVLRNTRGMQSETGIVDQARIAALDWALRIVGEGDSRERALLLATQAAELMYSGEWERRVRLSDEAVAIARGLDDPTALSTVLNLRFVTLLAPVTLDERRVNTVEATTAAEQLRDPMARFYAYHWRAYASIEAGDVVASRSWAAREQDIADRFRQPAALWLRRADEANLAIIAGRLDLADELATGALELGRVSEPEALVCYAAQETSIAFERGNLGDLVPLLEQAVRANPGVPGFRALLALGLSEGSRTDEARRLVDQAMVSDFPDLPYDVTWLAVACIYSEVSAKLEDRESATALYRMLEPWSEQIAFPAFGVWGPVSLYLGSLALVLGDTAAAEHHLMGAARAAIRAGAPLWEHRATSRLGQLAKIAQ